MSGNQQMQALLAQRQAGIGQTPSYNIPTNNYTPNGYLMGQLAQTGVANPYARVGGGNYNMATFNPRDMSNYYIQTQAAQAAAAQAAQQALSSNTAAMGTGGVPTGN